jgi:hypothetical protein
MTLLRSFISRWILGMKLT